MEVLFLLLSLLHLSFSVKHSLMYYMTGSPGIPSIPDFMAFGEVDGIETGYCDSNNKILQPRQDWAKETLDDELEHLCGQKLPDLFKIFTSMFQILFSQNGGVHVLQLIQGCEWDENTDEVTSIFLFGYDGEDVLEFDWKTRTFVAMKPEYDIFTWIPMGNLSLLLGESYTQICPWRLKRYLDHGKSSLQRTVLPSVSLLQKTPSSPVSCHATGFYPDRVMMFWRKDGEEIHENVYHTDVLPNNDDTFQMSVTLNVSSVTAEDWRRYDCVFQLSDPSSTIVTTLNNSVINTNWKKSRNQRNHQRNPVTVLIITAVVVVVLIALAAAGYFFCKKKKHVDNGTQLSENPNPEICLTNATH